MESYGHDADYTYNRNRMIYHGSNTSGLAHFAEAHQKEFTNLGRGTYLTNSLQAAKYYSMLSGEAADMKTPAFRNDLSRHPARDVRSVYEVSIAAAASSIHKFSRMPSFQEVAELRKRAGELGIAGIAYPDETFETCEDWNSSLGAYPENPIAFLIFDSANVTIVRELPRTELLGSSPTSNAALLPESTTQLAAAGRSAR
jgi:hypothetical protein